MSLGRSGKSNIADLEVVRQQAEVIQQLARAIETLRAELYRTQMSLREAETALSEHREHIEAGQAVMARFPSREAFDATFGDGDDASLRPGFAPVHDLEAWRRGQLAR